MAPINWCESIIIGCLRLSRALPFLQLWRPVHPILLLLALRDDNVQQFDYKARYMRKDNIPIHSSCSVLASCCSSTTTVCLPLSINYYLINNKSSPLLRLLLDTTC